MVPGARQRRGGERGALLAATMDAGVDVNVGQLWRRIHRWPRSLRWSLKGGVLLITVLLTLFPRFWLVPVWVGRLRHLNAVVDPNYPGLAGLEAQVAAWAGKDAGLADVLRPVEETVYQRIPYAYDWETWGVVDYVPTVAEVFVMGREDCDGRAVVAASLLQRLGYDAWLVTDLKHTWVVVCDRAAIEPVQYELMAPGEGEKTLTAGAAGTRVNLTLATVRNLGRATMFGMSVFPLSRELIILAAVVVTAVQPHSSGWRRSVGGLMLLAALLLLRGAGALKETEVAWWVCGAGGWAAVIAGWSLLAVKAAGRRSLPGPLR